MEGRLCFLYCRKAYRKDLITPIQKVDGYEGRGNGKVAFADSRRKIERMDSSKRKKETVKVYQKKNRKNAIIFPFVTRLRRRTTVLIAEPAGRLCLSAGFYVKIDGRMRLTKRLTA